MGIISNGKECFGFDRGFKVVGYDSKIFRNRIFKVLKQVSKDWFLFFILRKVKEQITNTHYIVRIQGYAVKEHSLNLTRVYS